MSRFVVVVVLALVTGCTEHGKGGGSCLFMGQAHQVGEVFPAGDGCNQCECEPDGTVSCTEIACNDGGVVIVDAGGVCGASGGCPEGPACGATCCRAGEICGSNGTCACGNNPACGAGDICAAGGPNGGDNCGFVCCGASGPCPAAE